MATKITTHLIDDLDGSNAESTVTFGLDGATYEIDLSKKNAKRLRDALTEFVDAGRKVSKGSGRRTAKKGSGTNSAEVREWARSNGYEVPDRGRVPREITEAFEAAN